MALPRFLLSSPVFALALCLAMAGAGPGQEEPPRAKKDSGDRLPSQEKEAPRTRDRERWEKLSPLEQEKLREIYRRLQALPQAKRQELLERLRKMGPEERGRAIALARERVKRRMGEAVPPEASRKAGKKELDGPAGSGKKRLRPAPLAPGPRSPPAARSDRKPSAPRSQEIESRLRKTIERWTEGLPPVVRDRVRMFTRREQLELFTTYKESEILMRAFPERAERDSILALPPEGLRALSRPEAARPEGLSPQSWERWRGLRPKEKQLVLRRLEKLREDRGEGTPALPEGHGAEPGGAPPSKASQPEARAQK